MVLFSRRGRLNRLVCRIIGHKYPNYKRDGCFMRCKRCGELIGIVATLYGVKFVERSQKEHDR